MNRDDLPETAEHGIRSIASAPSTAPRSPRVQVEVGAASHAGRTRPVNQDSFLVGRLERTLHTLITNLSSEQVPERFDEVAYGMMVADGLGGPGAGETASRLAVATFVHLVQTTPDLIMRIGEEESARVIDRIVERYQKIDSALTDQATHDPALARMATTLTFACSCGAEMFIGHVGDSRAYLIRGTELIRLTYDHTVAQKLADAGMISQREVERHRLRHVLTQALGPRGKEAKVDVNRLRLRDRDELLLCTDGLTGMIDEFSLPGLVAGRTVQEACDTLIEAALAAGGKDNVTVVLARYQISGSV